VPKIGRQKSPEEVANWKAALEEGYSYQHVAEMYNVNRETVRRYLPGMGWNRKQISAHGALMRNANASVLR
jgi:transposase